MAAFKYTDSKLPHLKTTIFSIMSQMARRYNAFNLSQGYPDFPSDPQLTELVYQAMLEGHNQYAPMQGVYALREQIALKTVLLYGVSYDPDNEITVTAGATQAIYTAISALVHPNDEVLLFKPSYDCYEPAVLVNGGKLIYSELNSSDFRVDWQDVSQKLSSKTKLIILNTPHNPTGSIWLHEDMIMLESLLKNTNTLVLSDEVYEHIIFDGKEHQSVCRFPLLRERSFICCSFGKTFHNTGWKIGYCLAPKELMWEFQKTHQFTVFSANHPIQQALVPYLSVPEHYLRLNSFYEQKRDFFLKCLSGSRFSIKPCAGTYFQTVGYERISEEGDLDFAKRLCKEHKIASIPISIFQLNEKDDRLLRFCFAKKKDTLEQAAEILCNL